MARVDINDVPIDYVLLTPSDTTNLSKVAFQGDNYPQRALYIELAGDICVTTLTTEKRTIPVPQGKPPYVAGSNGYGGTGGFIPVATTKSVRIYGQSNDDATLNAWQGGYRYSIISKY